MTLEDFFTLTEMKDGFTAPARVEELVAVMRKEKDCIVKNVADTTRQWSAVASTIAATESKDCLDLFIQLDGLWFIDRWIKDAQKFGNDTNDSYVEESITAMLRALENLHLDNEKLKSSGILITVKNLIGHNSSRIQDRARVLFDSWKQGGVDDAIHQDVEKVGGSHDDETTLSVKLAGEAGKPECSAIDNPVSKEIADDHNCEVEPMRDETFHDVPIQLHNDQLSSPTVLDRGGREDGYPDPKLSSIMSKSVEEPIKEILPICVSEGTGSNETCLSVLEEGSAMQMDVLKLNVYAEDGKQNQKHKSSSDKLSGSEFSSASTLLEPEAVHCRADDANIPERITDPALQNNTDDSVGGICQRTSVVGDDARTISSDPKGRMDDKGASDCCKARAFKSTEKIEDCYSKVLQESSSRNDCISGNSEDLDASLSRMEVTEAADEDKKHDNDGDEELTNVADFSKPKMDIKTPDLKISSRSNIELDYGIVDALEVARQVAQEVEREVVDYREQSCSSSSEKISGGRIRKSASSDSINGKAGQPIKGLPKESPKGKDIFVDPYQEGKECLTNADKLELEQENHILDMDSSQLTEAAQEQEADAQQGPCGFDLNEEVCSDDMDCQLNAVLTPISVVSASRPPAAPRLPQAPLQFEGTLGSKGSADNSPFHLASPLRVPDCGKTLSVGETSNSSKQRQDCLDFDLNVAEDGEYKLADPISGKQYPAILDLPSGESSVEVSSRKSERLKLDLNRVDYGDAPPSNFREERLFFPQNLHRSPSPASSSSSIQPSIRNIDLNDRPFLHNEFTDQGPYSNRCSQNVSSYGGPKPDDPVISIMGTRVEVPRKDLGSGTLSFSNGKVLESGMDVVMGRTGTFLGMGTTISHTHSPFFGYTGLTTGPTMSFSPAMHGPSGPIPYMVDSRGAPVVPQIIGSASAVPPYPQPFVVSMTGAPSSLHGTARSNFDLNSGFVIEGGMREPGGVRQLFVPVQGRSMEDHLRANSQPSSSSGVGGKRKEPDVGWESYPFNYKHQQPPWK